MQESRRFREVSVATIRMFRANRAKIDKLR